MGHLITLLISIDPGLSTGVAIFNDGNLMRAFTTNPPHAELRAVLKAQVGTGIAEVVCEQGPSIRRQADTCEPVEALVTEHAEHIHWVRPTAWKPSPLSVLLPGEVFRTKHERDAARMGRWFLARREASRAAPAAST